MVYEQSRFLLMLAFAASVISLAFFRDATPHGQWLTLWFVCTGLVYGVRMTTVSLYGNNPALLDTIEWERVYYVLSLLSGVCWALLGLFYTDTWPVHSQLILFLIYTGLVGGSFNLNASVKYGFPLFYIPVTVSLMFIMLQRDDGSFGMVATLFLIYIASMQFTMTKLYRRLTETLEIKFANKQMAEALKHANALLKELSEIDSLTSLANRRAFDNRLAYEWERHRRTQQPLSLLLIDVDYFKNYNDHFGHTGGDACLKKVARILKARCRRAADTAVRYGGEEFALILPETDMRHALECAEQIRDAFAQARIPHPQSQVSQYLTVSIGVSTMVPWEKRAMQQEMNILVEHADVALYGAKNAGRNQVKHCLSM